MDSEATSLASGGELSRCQARRHDQLDSEADRTDPTGRGATSTGAQHARKPMGGRAMAIPPTSASARDASDPARAAPRRHGRARSATTGAERARPLWQHSKRGQQA